MADKELEVIKKSKALVKHTYQLTSNSRRYPKKYRYSLVSDMQRNCMNIHNRLVEANRTDIRDYQRERLELQTQAITQCDELLFAIELSCDMKIISKRSMEYWSKMVTDIKHMAIAWRTSDRKR